MINNDQFKRSLVPGLKFYCDNVEKILVFVQS